VVPEAALDVDEVAADTFLWLSVGVLVVAGARLLPGRSAASTRLVAMAGSVMPPALVTTSALALFGVLGAVAAVAMGDAKLNLRGHRSCATVAHSATVHFPSLLRSSIRQKRSRRHHYRRAKNETPANAPSRSALLSKP
jgi:hypothetical protein